MKSLSCFLTSLLVCAAMCAQSVTMTGRFTASGSLTMGQSAGGTYASAPTYMTSISYPSTPPNVGGLNGCGTKFTDPLFGTQGVRVTCGNFDPSMIGNANNIFNASNAGSEDDQTFNSNDTLFSVSDTGGVRYLVGVNPNTLTLSRPYSANTSGCPMGNCSANGGWASGGNFEFSTVNPNVLYVGAAANTTLLSYTFDAPGFVTPPSAVTVVDFQQSNGNCLPTDFGTPAWTDDAGVPVNDAFFARALSSPAYYWDAGGWNSSTAYLTTNVIQPTNNNAGNYTYKPTVAGTSGTSEPNWASCTTVGATCGFSDGGVTWKNNGYVDGQNTAIMVGIYSPTKGCMMMNTKTGAITADVGWGGGSGLSCTTSRCTGTSTATGTFPIHNIKINKAGTILALDAGACISGTCLPSGGPWVWAFVDAGGNGSNIVYNPEQSLSTGHWHLGSLGMVNSPSSPTYQYKYRLTPLTGPSSTVTGVNNVPSPACSTGPGGSHSGWQNANATDTNPFLFTLTTYGMGGNTWGLLPYDQPWCAWLGEIDLAAMDGSGKVFREALTFNSGYSTVFQNNNAIANFSQTGNLAIESSDWFNTLRNAYGNSSSCVPNGPGWSANRVRATGYILTVSGTSYQATVGGTSGSSAPSWNSAQGATTTDGTVTWTSLGSPSGGANQCGIDVFLWKMQ